MQIPKRIQNHFNCESRKVSGDNTLVGGKITCCNKSDFELEISGEVINKFLLGTYLYSETGDIRTTLICKECREKLILFDSTIDGYRCCTENLDHKNIQSEKKWNCPKCKGNNFSVYAKYEYPNMEELKELGIKEKDNAFTWIVITVKCNGCGKVYKGFVDFDAT